ncbi:ABC transporter ATP-binding protein [Virgibacillus sp. W0181]|uniref:ABC transporter ATP-binding protein n=1 Tax=Virgibacillus sp. W0181 TaxID=3391581 RepID=UPI003F451AFE
MKKERVITLHELKMNYGNHQVLKGINLNVYRGDIVGYIGSNGAGKSTTIKIILGLLDGYTGMVEIFGKPLQKDNLEYKRRIGYVPESANMYEQLTSSEYLSFIGTLYGINEKTAREKAYQLLRLLNMEKAFHQRIDSFSKGMRQKVLIVSSLLHNPDIILMDEPLNGLDTNSASIIKQIFKRLADKGKTIFFSSHIMEVVENMSDRIILLSDGKIAADGDFTELKSGSGLGSLEEIFNQMTGFNNQAIIVNDFVDYVLNADTGKSQNA